jgi:hypothetical protein
MKRATAILFGLVIVAGGLLYLNSKGWQLRTPEGNNDQNTTLNSDRKTYKDEAYGFEFSYPKEYKFVQGGSQNYNVGEFFLGSGINLATVSLLEDSYPGTNYFDSFLTVSSDLNSSENDCKKSRQEGISKESELAEWQALDGLKFWRGKAIGAAAGTLAESTIYHTFSGGVCYEITLNIFEGNIGNYPEGTVAQVDKDDVFEKLSAVFETFRLQPGAANFLAKYLESYKDVDSKNNFAQVRSFLIQNQLDHMEKENMPLETNFTDFDSYEIISVEKNEKGFLGKANLFKNKKALKKPDGSEIMEISIIKEASEYKAESWYFVQ